MLLLTLAATPAALSSCSPWCTAPCEELNGNWRAECSSCAGSAFRCQASGTTGWSQDDAPRDSESHLATPAHPVLYAACDSKGECSGIRSDEIGGTGNTQGAAVLNTGAWMPLLGLGTWKMSTEVAVRLALQVGYRHLDCAAVYDNERMVGNVLKQMVGDGVGQVARRDLFITSKLWNTDHRAQSVRPALLSTLTDLGLEYLGAHHAAGSISPRGMHVYFCMHVSSGACVDAHGTPSMQRSPQAGGPHAQCAFHRSDG